MGQQQSEAGSTERAPSTGKPISVVIDFIHTGEQLEISEYGGQPVTSDWTAAHLCRPAEVHFRVPANRQRFSCLGEIAAEGSTLADMMRCSCLDKLPDRIRISLHLVERETFPQSLAPLVITRVPLEDRDLERPANLSYDHGWLWTMSWEAQERFGLSFADEVRAQASPVQHISLDRHTMAELSIPAKAEYFCFSYPSPAWEAIDSNTDPFKLNTWQVGPLQQYWDVLDFLRVGGFLYFDADGHIAAVSTLLPQTEQGSGALYFAEQQPWLPEWTAALVAENRMQPVTLKSLREKGARYFVWLHPEETLLHAEGKPCKQQPDIPHGGFAYIFHEDLYTEEREQVYMDRYFAVAAGPLTPRMRRPSRSFVEVSIAKLSFEALGEKPRPIEMSPREDFGVEAGQLEVKTPENSGNRDVQWVLAGWARCGLWCRGKERKEPKREQMERRRRTA